MRKRIGVGLVVLLLCVAAFAAMGGNVTSSIIVQSPYKIIFGSLKSTDVTLDKEASNKLRVTGALHATGAATVDGTSTLNDTVTIASAKTLAVTTADKLTVGSLIVPQTKTVMGCVQGTAAATATNYGIFFIADRAYTITAINEVHQTAGNNGSAVTLYVEKLTGTQALDNGITTQTGTFDLKATANTVQNGVLSATGTSLDLATGDRLALADTGTLTTAAGVCVNVTLKLK